MKKILAALMLMTSLMAWADAFQFQEGITAYNNRDYKTALEKFTQLANSGNVSATYNLGVMYDRGEGVVQDYKQAVRFFTMAAEQGDVRAQTNLGLMYRDGQGVVQDYKQAVRLFALAAEQGYVNAQNNLGVMYDSGQGVLQDNARAHMWYNIAAANGNGVGNAQKNRDIVAGKMTAQQIERAQQMARDCMDRNYKRCN